MGVSVVVARLCFRAEERDAAGEEHAATARLAACPAAATIRAAQDDLKKELKLKNCFTFAPVHMAAEYRLR